MCREESTHVQCESHFDLELQRRAFLAATGGVAVTAAGLSSNVLADKSKDKTKPKPAESLIRELHSTLSDDQKRTLVLPWNQGANKRGKTPDRLGMYNRAYKAQRIDKHYTKAQQDLLKRIFKSICNGDDGYNTISRKGSFDASKSFEGCGAHIFGDPTGDKKFAWLFTGHHLTVRCDGNSEPGAAFGGPMYYGHLVNGYSDKNAYKFQTERVQRVFDALSDKQRKKAVVSGNPGERARSIQFRKEHPGIVSSELSKDQRKLVADVMRDLIAPFRKEDGDEVMQIVKANGGLEKLHLAYYKDRRSTDTRIRWHFWRVEGPGFVWNFRVLPHVHCYVNIAKSA